MNWWTPGRRRHRHIGGPEILGQFLKADAIDRIDLFVMPVLLGEGIPLFGPDGTVQGVTLDACLPYPDGVVKLSYLLRARKG